MKNKIRRWVFGWLAGTFGITRSGASTVVTPGSGGQVLLGKDGTAAVPALAFSSSAQVGLWLSSGILNIGTGGTSVVNIANGLTGSLGMRVKDGIGLGSAGTSADVLLLRDAANTFAQRNGTAAQTTRIYGTYTDASNYEYLTLDAVTNAPNFTIATVAAGSGSDRHINLRAGGGNRVVVRSDGDVCLNNALVVGNTSANSANTSTRRVFKTTGIADNTATAVVTVTVPNANHSGGLRITLVSSNGSTDAFESTRVAEGFISIARTSGADTVAVAATLGLTAIATVSGGATHTLAYGVSAISGASSATQTFTVTVTIDDSGNLGSNQVLVQAELLNSESSGITIGAA